MILFLSDKSWILSSVVTLILDANGSFPYQYNSGELLNKRTTDKNHKTTYNTKVTQTLGQAYKQLQKCKQEKKCSLTVKITVQQQQQK